MSAPILAFFNNKGGVGKTSLVYHLSWMMSLMGHRVLAVDLDPQANLTSAFLDEEQLEALWESGGTEETIWGGWRPLKEGTGDVRAVRAQEISERLKLLAGDIALSQTEDELAQEWPRCNDGHARAFRVISSFWRILRSTAEASDSELILVDLGPNLGAINRAALLAADHIITPVAPDLFSWRGLGNMGPVFADWRESWQTRRNEASRRGLSLDLPGGQFHPLGYVVMQPVERLNRPIKSYRAWVDKMPVQYARAFSIPPEQMAAHHLGTVRHFSSLIPLAQEARKPVFSLRSADGALGSHRKAAERAGDLFRELSTTLLQRVLAPGPEPGG